MTAGDIFVKNMIPVCCGNFFAGCICVAASYSYAFGKLGQTNCGAKDNMSCITVGCDCMGQLKGDKPIESTTVQPKVESTPAQSSATN